MESTLNKYTDNKIHKLLNDNGAFWAFSNKQFEEQKQNDIKYVRMHGGLIAPKDKANIIHNGFEKIYNEAYKKDLKENGYKKIIWRNCRNLEIQYTDFDELVEALEGYKIDIELIAIEYNKYISYCVKNDLI